MLQYRQRKFLIEFYKMNITTTTTKNCKIYKHDACSPVTTTTQKCCIECIHPIEYLFELVFNEYDVNNNNNDFIEGFFRILDKGVIFYDCDICCTTCNDYYALGSIESILGLFEAVGLTGSVVVPPALPLSENETSPNPIEEINCCLNIKSNVEGYVKFVEEVGYDTNFSTLPFITCCNGFEECFEELICWIGSSNSTHVLGKGLVEWGQIFSNCNDNAISGLCVLIKTIKKYEKLVPNLFSSSNLKLRFIDLLLDKGMVFNAYCLSDARRMVLGSVETYLKYFEAVGLGPSPDVPPS